MILTDREIKIAVQRGLIIIDPSQANVSDIIRGLTESKKIPNSGYLLPPKTLALAWTKESLWSVISNPFFLKWRGLESNPPSIGSPEIAHVDTAIGETLVKLKRKTFFAKPCLAQHIGVVSSLRSVKLTPERQASHFAG